MAASREVRLESGQLKADGKRSRPDVRGGSPREEVRDDQRDDPTLDVELDADPVAAPEEAPVPEKLSRKLWNRTLRGISPVAEKSLISRSPKRSARRL